MEHSPKFLDQSQSGLKAERIAYPVSRRLERMRVLSRLLDTKFSLPGGFRFGIDPIIGLIPGIGDVIASTLSIWLVYDAARLGLQKRVVARMVINVFIETAVGTVPILGTLVDAVWKANARNMRMVEANYRPTMKERSVVKMVAFAAVTLILIYGSILFVLWVFLSWLIAIFGPIFSF
ncbi:MAG: DUF4112 domain-containing protein [Limisphaerales bacterium]